MKFNFVISGYNDDSNAMKLYEFDNCKVKELNSIILDNPSYVTSFGSIVFTYTKNPLYMVMFEVKNNGFKELDRIELGLKSMTHLTYSEKNKCLYGASYLDGCIVKIDVNDNKFGNLKKLSHKDLYGEDSKCHAIIMNEDETIVCVVNIATDSLYFYDTNLNLIKIIKVKDGAGPRHAIWVKNMIYCMTEYSNEVIVIDYDKGVIQYENTLLKETIESGIKSNGATLFMYNGFIYASNRGEETIAKFEVLKNKKIKYLGSFSCNGNHPRHMIEYSGLILNCNKNSNNVSIIDIESEKEVAGLVFPKPSGVCVVKQGGEYGRKEC